jgi:hypothetical protein
MILLSLAIVVGTLSLIRDCVVGVPRLEDVDWQIVSVGNLLPTDEEIGKERSGVGHMSALNGVKPMSVPDWDV